MAKLVLVVEDDEASLRLFNDLLQSHGCETLLSKDGLDALNLARTHSPDLILMDIKLPEISGLDHIKLLKAENDLKKIPVLAVTALVMKGDKEELLEAGFDGYISKPISVPGFLGEVKKYLETEPFRLTESLITGHPKIDAEHEQLRQLLNEFIVSHEEGDKSSCAAKIKEITKTVISHLKSEEEAMESAGYVDHRAHFSEHHTSLQKYFALIDGAEEAGFEGDFVNKLTAVLVNDMIRADLDFKVYLQNQKASC